VSLGQQLAINVHVVSCTCDIPEMLCSLCNKHSDVIFYYLDNTILNTVFILGYTLCRNQIGCKTRLGSGIMEWSDERFTKCICRVM